VEETRLNCVECQRELPIRPEQGAAKSAVLGVSLIEVPPPFGLPIEEGGSVDRHSFTGSDPMSGADREEKPCPEHQQSRAGGIGALRQQIRCWKG
jgi:hypothetical protein